MKQSQQGCRDCGQPWGEHANWCAQAPDEPDPYGRDADESDYADADDRLIAQITGEPREVR